jgi:zinc D-Ala-D-Ala carboxypeptidase
MRNVFCYVFLALIIACASTPTPDAPPQVSTLATGLPWPTIRNGSSGRDVVTAQYLLRSRGYSVSVDGAFGAGTESAAKSFQSAQGLSADGVIGANTWEKLVLTVQNGSSGDAVRAVQDQLVNRYGYNLTVDGLFGAGTASAVTSFQTSRGLTANGIVNLNTWSALTANSSGGTGAAIAARIRSNSRITLWPYSPVSSGSSDGADARSNMTDTANGLSAKRSCYGNAPCGTVSLSAAMLSGMESIAGTYTFRVTAIAGGSHSANSYHYAGRAFDVDTVNGIGVSASSSNYRAFMGRCRDLGAIEVLGPGDAGHDTHLHCAW